MFFNEDCAKEAFKEEMLEALLYSGWYDNDIANNSSTPITLNSIIVSETNTIGVKKYELVFSDPFINNHTYTISKTEHFSHIPFFGLIKLNFEI